VLPGTVIPTKGVKRVSTKKKTMKTLAPLLLFIAVFSGCSPDDDGTDMGTFDDDPSITSLNGTWKVISFEDYIARTVEHKNEENSRGGDIVITFNDAHEPHSISGQNITNAVVGEFEYRPARGLKVLNLGSTMVAQPAWADKFAGAITGTHLNYVINAAKLRIFYQDGIKSVTLVKQ